MILMKLTPLRAALALAVIAVCAASVAYGAIPAANGTISACVKQNGEIQKLVDTDAGETCTGNNRKLVTWSQQGPAGPQGTPGTSGYKVVSAESPIDGSDFKAATAVCPAGKKMLGGGAHAYVLSNGSVLPYVNASFSASMPDLTGSVWIAEATERTPSPDPWGIQVVALCATVAS